MLLPLNGHTVIEEVLSRCLRIPGIDEVVVATPGGIRDQPIAETIEVGEFSDEVSIIHGPEHNVFARYCIAANQTQADIIVRVTADCPLISPELCGEVVAALKRSNADYASNVEPRTFPQGMDCEAFTYEVLSRRWVATITAEMSAEECEHVTTVMRQSSSIKRVNVRSPWPIEGRLTLDTEDDYRVICAYFGHEPHQRLRAA